MIVGVAQQPQEQQQQLGQQQEESSFHEQGDVEKGLVEVDEKKENIVTKGGQKAGAEKEKYEWQQ